MAGSYNAEVLAATIRSARTTRRLSQVELADQLDVGQQAVSAWERGKSRPRADEIGRVAEALGLDEGELLHAAGYASRRPGDERPDPSLSPEAAIEADALLTREQKDALLSTLKIVRGARRRDAG